MRIQTFILVTALLCASASAQEHAVLTASKEPPGDAGYRTGKPSSSGFHQKYAGAKVFRSGTATYLRLQS